MMIHLIYLIPGLPILPFIFEALATLSFVYSLFALLCLGGTLARASSACRFLGIKKEGSIAVLG